MNKPLIRRICDIVIAIATAIITALSAVSCAAALSPEPFAGTPISNFLNLN